MCAVRALEALAAGRSARALDGARRYHHSGQDVAQQLVGYRLLTDLTLCIHFAFLLFVVCGGLLVRRYRWLLVPHLFAAGWGVYVEAMSGIRCPLTSLENALAVKAGMAGYSGTFIQHYLVPIIYPDGLTPLAQRVLAAAVVLINAVVYAWPRRTGVRTIPPS